MGSGTCILTEEIARAICEDWALTDKSFARIASELREEDHKVWPADISDWIKKKTPVTIDDSVYNLHDLLAGYRVSKEMDMMQTMLNIANTAAERQEDPRVTRNRIIAYNNVITHMQTRNLDPSGIGEAIGILPYNPRLHTESRDGTIN